MFYLHNKVPSISFTYSSQVLFKVENEASLHIIKNIYKYTYIQYNLKPYKLIKFKNFFIHIFIFLQIIEKMKRTSNTSEKMSLQKNKMFWTTNFKRLLYASNTSYSVLEMLVFRVLKKNLLEYILKFLFGTALSKTFKLLEK